MTKEPNNIPEMRIKGWEVYRTNYHTKQPYDVTYKLKNKKIESTVIVRQSPFTDAKGRREYSVLNSGRIFSIPSKYFSSLSAANNYAKKMMQYVRNHVKIWSLK